MTVLLALVPDTGHDQLWLLLSAQRMGPGLDPYGPQGFESNPPLAIWLSAIPVALARLLHLPLTVIFKACVLAIAAASAFVSAKLLRRLQPPPTRNQLWLLGNAFVLIFGALPARDFGQRDYILTLLILPYLIGAVVRVSTPSRIAITLAAALGLALKPHQSLIAIAIELTLLFRLHRIRRLEPTLFLTCGLAYFLAIRTLAPTYFTTILPILRDTYWAFGQLSIPQLLLAAIELLILAAITFAVCRRAANIFVPILLAAATAATLGFVLQGTGWYYQQLPAISLFALALALQLTSSAAPNARLQTLNSKYTPLAIGALTLLALALTLHFSYFHFTPRGIEQAQPTPDPAFFANLPPGTAVATLTTSVDDSVPPAFRYHLTLAQRYPHLWMLPAILRNESGPTPSHVLPPARLADLERLQHQFMLEDLTRWHPTLILVERCQDPAVHCQVLEDRHDNLLAWFERDPAFAALFSHYHLVLTSGPYAAYELEGSGPRDQGSASPPRLSVP